MIKKIVRTFFSACAFLLSLQTAYATDVGGPMFNDTIWDLARSPYNLIGDVLVKDGVTLTIDPGVVVNLQGMYQKYRIKIEGKLIARGTSENKIALSGGTVLFADSARDAIYDENGNYIDGCVLQYCKLENGGDGRGEVPQDNSYVALRGVALINSCSVLIDNCEFNKNSGSAIIVFNNGSARIINNLISENLINAENGIGAGIYLYSYKIILIENNTIVNNKVNGQHACGGGIGQSNSSAQPIVIKNNMISDNQLFPYGGYGGGIYLAFGNAIIENNTIQKNNAGVSEVSSSYGGGICLGMNSNNVQIKNNIISQNTARQGTAIFLSADSCITLDGNIIVENFAPPYGGGAAIEGALPNIFKNNTISRNIGSRVINFGNGYSTNPTITYNSVTDNINSYYSFIIPYTTTLTFNNNNIRNSGALSNQGAVIGERLNALNCWWGTDEELEVWQLIDRWEYVDYYPFLPTPETAAPVIPPVNFTATKTGSDTVALTWDPNPETDIAGYRVYYDIDQGFPYTGQGAVQGSSPIDVSNTTSFSLSNLQSSPYYLAVTAYDNDGNESWFSAEKEIILIETSSTTTSLFNESSTTTTSTNSTTTASDSTSTVPPSDKDNDGIPDYQDNCPNVPNPDQTDSDGNGIGDECDTQYWKNLYLNGKLDNDNDGILNACDNCPNNCNIEQLDADGDGIGDVCDPTPGCGGCNQPQCEQECFKYTI
jgi:hypothetical protein